MNTTNKKQLLVGAIVSTHIDIPVEVPGDFDLKNTPIWKLKEMILDGKITCPLKDVSDELLDLISGRNTLHPTDINHLSNELLIINYSLKKIDYVLEVVEGFKKYK